MVRRAARDHFLWCIALCCFLSIRIAASSTRAAGDAEQRACPAPPRPPPRRPRYGGVLAPDGCIYGLPYAADGVLKIDPVAQSVSILPLPDEVAPGGYKWHGGALGPDGNIYGYPAHAERVLKVRRRRRPSPPRTRAPPTPHRRTAQNTATLPIPTAHARPTPPAAETAGPRAVFEERWPNHARDERARRARFDSEPASRARVVI